MSNLLRTQRTDVCGVIWHPVPPEKAQDDDDDDDHVKDFASTVIPRRMGKGARHDYWIHLDSVTPKVNMDMEKAWQ